MEIWDLYTENRIPTGLTVERSMYGHIDQGYFHMWVQVWVKNSEGLYVFSQRAKDKDTDPLKWECVAGHSLAGETSLEAAVREVREEVGITLDPSKGRKLLTRIRERVYGINHYNIHDVWLFESDEAPDLAKALTPEEVAQTGYRSLEEIIDMYKRGETTENIRYAYNVKMNPPKETYPEIGKTICGVIDRPINSAHWEQEAIVYRLNAGYECESNHEVYVIDDDEPSDSFEGKIIAVYHRYSDNSDIYIVSTSGQQMSEDDILARIAFREQYYYGRLCFK